MSKETGRKLSGTDIVITGAGVVSAIGVGKLATLKALRACQSGIGQVQYLQTTHHELPVGEVKLSDEEMQQLVRCQADGQEPLCRTTLMARLAMREALAEAGLLDAQAQLVQEVDGRMPFISGTTVAGMDRGENLFTSTEHDEMMRQMIEAKTDCGSNTQQIARGFGRFALLDTISTACSSALNAIEVGANLLKTGCYEMAVVGGTESLSRFHLNGFNTLMILDHEQCRPFDATRAGLNLGEGAGYLVIETLASALRRGAKPLAVISGYGNACDAFHQTASSEDGEGAYRAMRQAIEMAGLQPSDIDYVNAHGTGTPNNDPSELRAMHRVFDGESSASAQVPLSSTKESAHSLPPYSSTKGFTGHTTSASGSIEAVFCLLALQHQFLPVSLGCHEPIEGEPSPVGEDTPLPAQGLRHILCNAFGFGGNDSSMLFSSMEAFANDQASVENQEASDHKATETLPKRIFLLAGKALNEDSPEPDFKQYMSAGEARRLGKMLKRTMAVSMQTLRDAGQKQEDGMVAPFVPDAIITGTAWGNAESSETFLRDMLTGGEQLLKPTPFMQSTHNTIGSLIAISTRNHGYNNTHSQGSDSLRMALLDAWMLMQQGQISSALVGLHDCVPGVCNEAYLLVTEEALPVGITPLRELDIVTIETKQVYC